MKRILYLNRLDNHYLWNGRCTTLYLIIFYLWLFNFSGKHEDADGRMIVLYHYNRHTHSPQTNARRP